jgi:AcrR family transcriptional regulator
MVMPTPLAAAPVDPRDAILDAMERLLARYGYRKTTVDDLAREAGIGKGTVYLHFPSKEEVALCSIDRVVGRVQERLRELAASPAPAPERLRRMLAARVLLRFDSVRAYSQGLDDLFEALRPAYMARRSRYFEAESEIFAAVLARGRREKTLSCADPSGAAQALLLATNALLPYSLSARELGERADIEKKVNRLADLLLYGLLPRAGP